MHAGKENNAEEQPPILGSWKRLYWFVAWFNILLISLFYAISKWLN